MGSHFERHWHRVDLELPFLLILQIYGGPRLQFCLIYPDKTTCAEKKRYELASVREEMIKPEFSEMMWKHGWAQRKVAFGIKFGFAE